MWDESFGKKIGTLLNLMHDKPNARPAPEGGDIEIFDGGKCITMSGLVQYKFSDGSEAHTGTSPNFGDGPDWYLTIQLATGEKVKIELDNVPGWK